MSWEVTIKGLMIAAVVVVVVFLARRLQAPRSGTQRLAITVWAAFGPYDSADAASDSLRWASRAVFGKIGTTKHQEWMDGHIKNFREWEARGSFEKMQKIMRGGLLRSANGHAFETACQRFRDEAMRDVTPIMESLNSVLEKTGHKLESAKRPNGTYDVLYKKIWSDDEIEQKDREVGEAALNEIGNNLLEDDSDPSVPISVRHAASLQLE
jgi:hypothetical protein